ncbi:hypothetical protein BDV93DRAFT_234012 [Ceratobasidium sp. AG-I]|nr:hypothetical protein BDV93DRAFT_234012 [Ceratobasidium sp. AG-I]
MPMIVTILMLRCRPRRCMMYLIGSTVFICTVYTFGLCVYICSVFLMLATDMNYIDLLYPARRRLLQAEPLPRVANRPTNPCCFMIFLIYPGAELIFDLRHDSQEPTPKQKGGDEEVLMIVHTKLKLMLR